MLPSLAGCVTPDRERSSLPRSSEAGSNTAAAPPGPVSPGPVSPGPVSPEPVSPGLLPTASTVAVSVAPPTPPRTDDAVWSEDFAGAAGTAPDASLLTARSGGNGWGNAELQSYTARGVNAALDGSGHLALRAVRERYTGPDGIARAWTSARLDSLGKWSFTAGTLSVRMKVPAGTGMWPAFWLMGSDLPTVSWPAAGEIDVVEALGGKNVVYQSVHGPRPGRTANGTGNSYAHSVDVSAPAHVRVSDDYHVYSVTRRPGRIAFFVDGRQTGVLTPATLTAGQRWVFDKPMFLLVNLAVGGWPGTPVAETPSPSTLLVDWIRFTP